MDYKTLEDMIRRGETESWHAMVSEAYGRPVNLYRRGMRTREEMLEEIRKISFGLYDRFFGAGSRREGALHPTADLQKEMQEVFCIPDALGRKIPEGVPTPHCFRKMYGTYMQMEVRMEPWPERGAGNLDAEEDDGWSAVLSDTGFRPDRKYVIHAPDGVTAYLRDVAQESEQDLLGYHIIRYRVSGHVIGYSSPADRDLKLELKTGDHPLLLITFEMQPEDYQAFESHWKEYVAFCRQQEQDIDCYYETLADRWLAEKS
ncbi:MAG: hypothetical protein J6N77_00505 [Lachnospiraceae bacterium]|nr:hypothetical protein [Lachnospiraceae bacterium]